MMRIFRTISGGTLQDIGSLLRARVQTVREASGVQLISPIGLSLVALLPLFLSMLIPPSAYSSIVHEPNLMFGNMQLLGFYVACVVTHIVGCLLVVRPVRKLHRLKRGDLKSSAWLMIAIPLVLVLLIDLASWAIIMAKNPRLISMMLSGHGNEAKNALVTTGALGGAQPLLAAVVWWAAMRYHATRNALDLKGQRLIKLLIAACVLVGTMVALTKLARYELMPLYLGLLVVWLRQFGSGKSAWFFVAMGALAVIGVVGMFLLFSLLRGQDLLINIIGYGPTSFNHLAALLSGQLQYPADGNYTVGFLSKFPLLGRFLPAVSDPDSLLAFEREFDLTRSAGLNGSLIWVTTWGYYYTDLGLGVFILAVILGVVSQLCWNAFNRLQVFGLVLYPLLATSIALWITTSFLARSQTTVIVLAAVLLWAWERAINWYRPTGANVSSAVRRGKVLTTRA